MLKMRWCGKTWMPSLSVGKGCRIMSLHPVLLQAAIQQYGKGSGASSICACLFQMHLGLCPRTRMGRSLNTSFSLSHVQEHQTSRHGYSIFVSGDMAMHICFKRDAQAVSCSPWDCDPIDRPRSPTIHKMLALKIAEK